MSAPARYGYTLCIAGLLGFAGCDRSAAAVPVTVVDLIHEFDRAERGPSAGYRVAIHTAGGVARPAIVMPAPSRVIWNLRLPRRGLLRTSVALEEAVPGAPAAPVRFRIGISDYRTYEGLTQISVTPEQPGWIDLRTDLSGYAGRKWSLFYRPDRVVWRLVLAADAPHGSALAVWGSPEVVTDAESAKEYVTRLRVSPPAHPVP